MPFLEDTFPRQPLSRQTMISVSFPQPFRLYLHGTHSAADIVVACSSSDFPERSWGMLHVEFLWLIIFEKEGPLNRTGNTYHHNYTS